MSRSTPGGASTRWAIGALLVAGAWIVAYWIVPAPSPANKPDIEFGPPPDEGVRPRLAEPLEPDPIPQAPPDTTPAPEAPDPSDSVAPLEPRVTPPTFYQYRSTEGDTFAIIADKFFSDSTKWPVIARANPMMDPNKLRPGTIVLVPVDEKNIQGVENPQGYEIYTVQPRDTLSDIAKKVYGKSSLWGIIAAANPDIDPNRLQPGSTLKIPPAPPSNPPR